MKKIDQSFMIIMADDDPDDYYLMREALSEQGINCQLRLVSDGVELMDYLLLRGQFADMGEAPRPNLIILDLNMPRMDGRQALLKIKTSDSIKEIPIVVFTTSKTAQDIRQCYQAGANSYIAKPATFEGLLDVVDCLKKYWMETVILPGCGGVNDKNLWVPACNRTDISPRDNV